MNALVSILPRIREWPLSWKIVDLRQHIGKRAAISHVGEQQDFAHSGAMALKQRHDWRNDAVAPC
jgi:hypothetical protein